MKVLEKDKVLA
jgi:serine/threonine protein kinase